MKIFPPVRPSRLCNIAPVKKVMLHRRLGVEKCRNFDEEGRRSREWKRTFQFDQKRVFAAGKGGSV